MVVTHSLAPVGESEIRIELLRLSESFSGFIKLEAVKVLDSFNEFRLSCGRAGIRKSDVPELLCMQAQWTEKHDTDRECAAGAKVSIHRYTPFKALAMLLSANS